MVITVPSRPTSLPFSFSRSIFSFCSSSSFRRRKKLLKDIQRLGLALSDDGRLPSPPPGLISPSLGRADPAEGLVQLLKCLWRRLVAWYGEEVDLGGGKGGFASAFGLVGATVADALWDFGNCLAGVSFLGLDRHPSVEEKRDLGLLSVSLVASGGRA